MNLTILKSLKFVLKALILFLILTHAFSWLLFFYSENLNVTLQVLQNQSASKIVFLRASVAFLPVVVVCAAWSCHYWSKRVFMTAFLISLLYFLVNFSTLSISLPLYLVPISCLAICKGFLASIWKKKEQKFELGLQALPA